MQIRFLKLITILFSLSVVSACDSSKQEKPPVLFKPQQDALDKAKGVQQTIDQTPKRIEQAEEQPQKP